VFVIWGDGVADASVVLVLYALGLLLLELALRRDPECAQAKAFIRSCTAEVWVAGLFLLALALGPALDWRAVGLVFLALSDLFLLLWLRSRPERPMAQSASSLALLCGSLVLMLLVGEMVFRLPWIVARTGGNNPGMLAWEGRHYDDVERRNPLGLRSFHTAEPKAAGVRRIVVLGDSFSHGDKVARTEDLWPYVLERALRQQSGQAVEAINLGRGGLTTVNEAEMLEGMGWLFEPDLVIVQFTLNDPLPSGPGMQHHNEGWVIRTVPLVPGLHSWLNRRSYLYSFVDRQFWALQVRVFFPRGYAALYDDDLPAWKACRAALGEIAASARGRGVPVIVALFPLLVEDLSERGYPYLEVHEKIREAAAAAELPLLDLRPVFAARDPHGRAWWALPSDWHPGVEGHRVAGQAVASEILARGLLGPP
jgi:hypothetical protein